jgi:hypothetical protein
VPKNALITIESPEPPDLARAAGLIGVELDAMDAEFGVVPIDPARGLYCVQVDGERLPRDFSERQPFSGPYANPRIEKLTPDGG